MITIVSKDYCPYCVKAKQLISSLGFEYTEVDVTSDPDMLRKSVVASGMMSVPQIYAGDIAAENILGGYDDIAALHNEGALIDRLTSAH